MTWDGATAKARHFRSARNLNTPAFLNRRPTGSQVKVPVQAGEIKSHNPDHIGGYRIALATFSGMETKFGLVLPRYNVSA